MDSTNANQKFDQQTSPNEWSSGLCDCFTDCRSCCLTFWCPCIAFGRIAEIADRGHSSCGSSGALYCLLGWLSSVTLGGWCTFCYSCGYRTKLRQQFLLEESPCGDCCVHFWCEGCALCQEYRELQSRGFDMSIGWHANVERRTRGVAMASAAPPGVESGMTR